MKVLAFKAVVLLNVLFHLCLEGSQNHFSVELGGFGSDIQSFVNNSSASDPLLSSNLLGFGRFKGLIFLSQSITIEPSIGLSIPWASANDGAQKVLFFQHDVNLGVFLLSWLKTRLGVGLHEMFFFGGGDGVVLNNGNSTATYYSGGDLTLTNALTTNIGFSFQFSKWFNIYIDLNVLNVMSASQRSFNATACWGFFL